MNATVWVSGAAVRRVALLATLVRERRGEVDTRDTASDPDVAVANPSCLMLDDRSVP